MKTMLLPLLAALGVASIAHAELIVVATTPDLGAIAKEIAGDKADITSLCKPTDDPHFVDVRPNQLVKLNRADVLLEGGAELENGWLPALVHSARNPRITNGAPGWVLCSRGIQLLEVPPTQTRWRDDVHPLGNPHYMTDPANARLVAKRIAEVLAQVDLQSADTYQTNLKQFTDQLDVKLVEWQKLLSPFRGQHIAANDDSWPYFARRFDLKIEIFLEPKPRVSPTRAYLSEVVARMKQVNTRVIMVQPYFNRRTAETVAHDTGATVVEVASLPGGLKGTEENYFKMMDHLVNSLAKVLSNPSP